MTEQTDKFGQHQEPEGNAPIKDVSDIVAELERSDLRIAAAVAGSYTGSFKRSPISIETYDRMIDRSPILRGSKNKFFESITADVPNLTYTGEDKEKGELMKDYLTYAFPEHKLNNFIWNILNSVFYGFSVGEYCYQGKKFQDRQVIVPPTYKPNLLKFLYPNYIKFHSDKAGNLLVNHRSPNTRDKHRYKEEHGISYSYNANYSKKGYYLSPNKALITTFNADGENRYGRGLLRAIYEPWYILDKTYMTWAVALERKGIPAKVFYGKESDQIQTFAKNADRGVHQNFYGDKDTFKVDILETKTIIGQQFKILTDDLKFLIYFGLGMPTAGINTRVSADSAATEYEDYARTKKQAYRRFVESQINEMFHHYIKINFNIQEGEPMPFLRYPPVVKGDISKYADAVLKLRTMGLINENDYDLIRWQYFGLENMDGEPEPLVLDNKMGDTPENKGEGFLKYDSNKKEIQVGISDVSVPIRLY